MVESLSDLHVALGTLLASGVKLSAQEEILVVKWARLLREMEARKEEFKDAMLDLQMEYGTVQFIVLRYRAIVEKGENAAREKRKRKIDAALGSVESIINSSLNDDDTISSFKEALKKLKVAIGHV